MVHLTGLRPLVSGRCIAGVSAFVATKLKTEFLCKPSQTRGPHTRKRQKEMEATSGADAAPSPPAGPGGRVERFNPAHYGLTADFFLTSYTKMKG
jgi:hypothetical protein